MKLFIGQLTSWLMMKDIYISSLIHSHLIKTARNCLHRSSSSPTATRHLFNQDGCIMLGHIYRLVCDDLNRHTRKLPKLTIDHVNLTSYSVMNVRLAAQVLSTSVANLTSYSVMNVRLAAQVLSTSVANILFKD